ncbi:hypothetical protein [Cuneatibacter caecimuris]|uniref:hypothetical protein n=1 Tax=Cuneatibacter caecimuris TaxID=1796618 RepID=UPI0013EEA730|nr:hypothetical protein [Cuneatibacter caecimuris]
MAALDQNGRRQYTQAFMRFFLRSFLFCSTSGRLLYAAFRPLCHSRAASLWHPGQYFCRPLSTVYSFPQRWQISTLPSFLFGPPDCLRSLSISFFLLARHSGHLLARGPPGNDLPQSIQIRSRIVLFCRDSFAHSGHMMESMSPWNTFPHREQVLNVLLFTLSPLFFAFSVFL